MSKTVISPEVSKEALESTQIEAKNEDVKQQKSGQKMDAEISESEHLLDNEKSIEYLDKSFEQVTPLAQRAGYDSETRIDPAKGEEIRRSKPERYSSRAKVALGSVIDIVRSSFLTDTVDRKAARYMNTYKLESDNPFNTEKVDKILKSVMIEALENLTYDPDKCPKQAKWASLAIRSKVKELEFDRYKIICMVTIGEKNSQDVLATCRFLWDADKDRYSVFSMENTFVFGIAQCFGLYYE